MINIVDAQKVKETDRKSDKVEIYFSPSEQSQSILFDNGLKLTFGKIERGVTKLKIDSSYYTYIARQKIGKKFYVDEFEVAIEGVQLELENTSNDVLVIKTGESVIELGSFAGVPFTDNTKYSNAGSRDNTPDITLTPKMKKSVGFYLSRIAYFVNGRGVNAEPVPKDRDMAFQITLKIINGTTNTSKYYTVNSYPIKVTVIRN